MQWSKGKVRITAAIGKLIGLRNGYVSEDFGVHRDSGEWIVTHLKTGLKAMDQVTLKTSQDAKNLADTLTECIDWDSNDEKILKERWEEHRALGGVYPVRDGYDTWSNP